MAKKDRVTDAAVEMFEYLQARGKLSPAPTKELIEQEFMDILSKRNITSFTEKQARRFHKKVRELIYKDVLNAEPKEMEYMLPEEA